MRVLIHRLRVRSLARAGCGTAPTGTTRPMPEDAPDRFSLQSERHDSSLELVAEGELDMAAAFNFESKVEALLGEDDLRTVVLDLGRVDFVDSAGLGALLSVRNRARELGIDLEMPRVSGPVQRILDVTGIGDISE